MQKVKIEAVGEPKSIQGAKGPFQVFGVKANGAWMNGYYNKQTQGWKVGDEVEVLITEKPGKDGKMYKNFSLPKVEDVQTERIAKLEGRVTRLELSLERLVKEEVAKAKSDLCLELTGKVQTTSDYKKMQEPHPLYANDPFEGVEPSSEPQF